jgi:hypothetical protein
VPWSSPTAGYMCQEIQTITRPSKRFTLDVEVPKKALTEVSNLSKVKRTKLTSLCADPDFYNHQVSPPESTIP